MAVAAMNLEAGTHHWVEQLRDLLNECAGSRPADEQDRLREAVALLKNPSLIHARGIPAEQLARIEAMLECGAMASAAFEIVGKNVSFMVSRGHNGVCMASAVSPEDEAETICEASTVALAMVAAYLSMILSSVDNVASQGRAGHSGEVSTRLH